MSELKDKLTKEVSEIDKTISNPEERTKVMGIIQEMIENFTRHVVNLTERQNEIDEKVAEIYEILLDIESELVQGFADDLQAECPYCGEEIPLEFKDGEFVDFECPKCHNLIEMEMMLDKIKSGEVKHLPLIIKADVQGSIEAIEGTVNKLSNEEVSVQILHSAVGAISESDISLAKA